MSVEMITTLWRCTGNSFLFWSFDYFFHKFSFANPLVSLLLKVPFGKHSFLSFLWAITAASIDVYHYMLSFMTGSQIFSITFSVGPTEQSFTAEAKSKLNRFLYCRHALTRSLQVFFQPKKNLFLKIFI